MRFSPAVLDHSPSVTVAGYEERGLAELAAQPPRNPRVSRRAVKHEIVRAVNAPKSKSIEVLIRENVRMIAYKALSDGQQKAWINSLQFKSIGRIARMLPHEV